MQQLGRQPLAAHVGEAALLAAAALGAGVEVEELLAGKSFDAADAELLYLLALQINRIDLSPRGFRLRRNSFTGQAMRCRCFETGI
jgi:hypothetical protein